MLMHTLKQLSNWTIQPAIATPDPKNLILSHKKDFQVCVRQEQSMTVQLFRFVNAMNEHTRKKQQQETVQSG